MKDKLTWKKLCNALAVNKATIGFGGIFYCGGAYRQTSDRKGLEAWDSRKNGWVRIT